MSFEHVKGCSICSFFMWNVKTGLTKLLLRDSQYNCSIVLSGAIGAKNLFVYAFTGHKIRGSQNDLVSTEYAFDRVLLLHVLQWNCFTSFCMCPFMTLQVTRLCEAFITLCASIWFFSWMGPLMYLQAAWNCKALVTISAFEWCFSFVNPLVFH